MIFYGNYMKRMWKICDKLKIELRLCLLYEELNYVIVDLKRFVLKCTEWSKLWNF